MVLAPFLLRTFTWDVGGSQVAAVSRRAGPSGPLPQQRIAAAAVVARFAHQQVERETRQIVGYRIDARVFLLVEDLAVGMTVLARLGADGPGVALDRVVGDVRGALALAAGDAHQVPFAGTQRTVQKPVALGARVRADDAGDWQRAAHGTEPRDFERGHLLGRQATREGHPVHLQPARREGHPPESRAPLPPRTAVARRWRAHPRARPGPRPPRRTVASLPRA